MKKKEKIDSSLLSTALTTTDANKEIKIRSQDEQLRDSIADHVNKGSLFVGFDYNIKTDNGLYLFTFVSKYKNKEYAYEDFGSLKDLKDKVRLARKILAERMYDVLKSSNIMNRIKGMNNENKIIK